MIEVESNLTCPLASVVAVSVPEAGVLQYPVTVALATGPSPVMVIVACAQTKRFGPAFLVCIVDVSVAVSSLLGGGVVVSIVKLQLLVPWFPSESVAETTTVWVPSFKAVVW